MGINNRNTGVIWAGTIMGEFFSLRDRFSI